MRLLILTSEVVNIQKMMKQRAGNNPGTAMYWVLGIFGLLIVAILYVFVANVFFDPSSPTAGIFTNNSYAANITTMFQTFVYNIFAQLPNVGKIIGITFIFAVFGAIGYGGYMGYNKMKGG